MFLETASPSKLNTYQQCKYKYKLYYVDKLPGTFNTSLNIEPTQWGSYIHKVYELGLECKTLQELNEIAKTLRPKYQFSDKKLSLLPKLLQNFLRLNSKLFKTIATEFDYSVEFNNGMKFNGIIDRIVETPDKKLIVIDYKTGRNQKSKFELSKDTQMLQYAYVTSITYKVPIRNILCCHYYPEFDKLVDVRYTDQDLSAFLYRMKEKFWEIRKKKVSECHPNKGVLCDWCGYKDICPAFNSQELIQSRLDEARIKKLEENKEI